MSKKNATKNAAAADNNAAQIAAEAFAAAATAHADRLQLLLAMDVSTMSDTEAKEHKASMLAEKNRAERCASFAKLLQSESFAAAFVRYNLTAAAVQRLQIYAQDKLAATLRAIAADCALSAIAAGNHSNSMTQRLVEVLQTDGECTIANAPRRMHDLHSDKSMGTYSAQASSSRQVLELLGMIEFDALTKAFRLSDEGKAKLHVIAV